MHWDAKLALTNQFGERDRLGRAGRRLADQSWQWIYTKRCDVPAAGFFRSEAESALSVKTESGAHAPSRVEFGALAEHLIAPATINRQQRISCAPSARRGPDRCNPDGSG